MCSSALLLFSLRIRHHGGGAAIAASWQPAAAASDRFAACASYEVEAAAATGGQPLKQTCAGRVHDCTLHGAQPGCAYLVRMHCTRIL